MADAWGYVRISQESDASLDAQMESIRQYARSNDLSLQTTKNDGRNTSGFDADRDGYQLIREKIRDGSVDAIITRDRARMSRDFDERLDLIASLREHAVEWHVVEEGGRLHLEDVQRAGIECLHAMMDHYKKMVEIERSKKAIAKRQERGCYQGSTPFGLEFADDGCHLQRSDRWAALQRIFELEDDHGVTEIAQRVGEPSGTVSRILDNGLEHYVATLDEYSVED